MDPFKTVGEKNSSPSLWSGNFFSRIFILFCIMFAELKHNSHGFFSLLHFFLIYKNNRFFISDTVMKSVKTEKKPIT